MQESSEQTYSIDRLSKSHQRKTLSCGINELDAYLHKQAGQENRRQMAVTYILNDEETNKIAGYYTLSAATIELTDLPDNIARKLPRYPLVPATLIGRLAIDLLYQKQGLGEILLIDALHRSYQTSQDVASFAVIVNTINDNAIAFYKKYGFLPLPAKKHQLYLSMKTVGKI